MVGIAFLDMFGQQGGKVFLTTNIISKLSHTLIFQFVSEVIKQFLNILQYFNTNNFNIPFFRNIVREDEWFFNDDSCLTERGSVRITDAWRNKPKTRWVAHVRK